jgi:hypothetical protein
MLIQRCAIDELCRRSPLYWLQNWTKTFDEHWREKGCEPYRPFPKLPYLAWLIGILRTERRLFIPKSREMMVSWVVMAYAVHKAQFNEKTRVILQTQKEDKSADLINGRGTPGYAATLYARQPEWLKDRHPLSKPLKEQPDLLLSWGNGSIVQGLPKGADQIRQYHPTIMIFDEAAHLDEFEAAYGAADPVCQQIIAVSSVAPGWFWDQVHPDGKAG